jgi:deazaflavin-dependent oxidoreductase (nitroreductase family)
MSDPMSDPEPRAAPRPPRREDALFDMLTKSDLVRPLEMAALQYTGLSLVTYFQRVRRGFPYIPTLLLTTVGRRSGRLHRVGLGYYAREHDFVICGSLGGAAHHPAWYSNLVAHPLAWATVNRATAPIDTRTAVGDEHAELWQWIIGLVPEYRAYERRAAGHRQMPLVVCSPRAPLRLSRMG